MKAHQLLIHPGAMMAAAEDKTKSLSAARALAQPDIIRILVECFLLPNSAGSFNSLRILWRAIETNQAFRGRKESRR